MAGSLALTTSEQVEKPVSAIRDQWQISFARFITYPSLPSTCPSLVPLPHNRRYRSTRGSWISSLSSTASLQLHNCHSTSSAILSVCFGGMILEEHYILKLHFSWPQLSCVPGYPPKGSRTVFVSYRDLVDKIQKFAFLFSTIFEAETFMNAVKNILRDPTETEPLNTDFQSEISSQSVFMSTNRPLPRACVEEMSCMTPIQAYSPQLPLSLNYEIEQESHAKETTLNCKHEGIPPTFPPSFLSLLTNCCSEAKEAAAEPILSEEIDLKSQIARYMDDSSFQDMLVKVEKVISEIGEDLML